MKIGDVSKFLHLSDQMIRYYEKNGIISPKRSDSSNYREYSFMDAFQLFDAMKYKEWDISIKEISELIQDNYYSKLSSKVDKYIEKNSVEIEYKIVLNEKLKRISKELQTAKYNMNRYWIDLVPERILFFSGTSQDDDYGDSKVSKENGDMIFSSKYISFFDVATIFNHIYNEWYYCIDSEEYQRLHLEDYQYQKKIEECYCLCTIIDMGEAGNFSEDLLQPVYQYMNDHHLQQIGLPFGKIIGRGNENHQFTRLMKILIPIKTL